jgi:DNA modification methylase
MPDDSVDLVFGSPPYPSARTYGIDFCMDPETWATWMLERWREWARISKGAVCMVVDDSTENFSYGGGPFLLGANLVRAGFKLRHPGVYERDGIPGSGGSDWLKQRWEFIICTAKGKLPWSNNVACGTLLKYDNGGKGTYRNRDGSRNKNPHYAKPKSGLANPGNIIKCDSGGGKMGSRLAELTEAPFPEALAERFVKSFCPPDGVCLDPFGGSGTTLAVALKNGRRCISIDIRESQIELMKRRAAEVEAILARPVQGQLLAEGAK